MRRYVLILGLALLCVTPILGSLIQGADLHARPYAAEITVLPSPAESR